MDSSSSFDVQEADLFSISFFNKDIQELGTFVFKKNIDNFSALKTLFFCMGDETSDFDNPFILSDPEHSYHQQQNEEDGEEDHHNHQNSSSHGKNTTATSHKKIFNKDGKIIKKGRPPTITPENKVNIREYVIDCMKNRKAPDIDHAIKFFSPTATYRTMKDTVSGIKSTVKNDPNIILPAPVKKKTIQRKES